MPERRTTPQPIGKNRWVFFGSVLLVGVLPVWTGCDESVGAFSGTDLPFTLWGFMNAGSDTQFVRVFPISDELIPDPAAGIDARVYSTNLTTGERVEWSYEAVQFDSLISGHIFWSPFRARHLHRYRLEVVRSDGATSTAEATVPSEAEFNVTVNEGSTKIPVVISGQIPNLVGIRVTYNAVNVPPIQAWPIGTSVPGAVQFPVTIGYDQIVTQQGDEWFFEIDMIRDYVAVNQVYALNCLITGEGGSAPDVWLRTIEFSALAADSSWAPPGGEFDPNLLSVPGTFSNVENGYGFFGAGQGIRFQWTPSQSVAQTAGYNFVPKCQGLFPREEPECMDPPRSCIGEVLPDLWRIWLR